MNSEVTICLVDIVGCIIGLSLHVLGPDKFRRITFALAIYCLIEFFFHTQMESFVSRYF